MTPSTQLASLITATPTLAFMARTPRAEEAAPPTGDAEVPQAPECDARAIEKSPRS